MAATPLTLTAYFDASWSSMPKLIPLICKVKAVVSYCCACITRLQAVGPTPLNPAKIPTTQNLTQGNR